MNCEEYTDFYRREAVKMPGLLPPGRHAACRGQSDAPGVNMEQQATPEMLSEPTALELAQNFTAAMAKWSLAGFPVVSEEDYRARAEACDACEFWDGKARLGLGKCNAPGCGCTKLKRWLATEPCPLGKWPGENQGRTGPADGNG